MRHPAAADPHKNLSRRLCRLCRLEVSGARGLCFCASVHGENKYHRTTHRATRHPLEWTEDPQAPDICVVIVIGTCGKIEAFFVFGSMSRLSQCWGSNLFVTRAKILIATW